MKYTIEELQYKKEDQTFERKSARIDPKGIANHLVAFANADGGILVIGIEDDGTITGIDNFTERINDIHRIPFDFCIPTIPITTEKIKCIDKDGKKNHLLILTIPASSELHTNHQDDAYYHMGDKSHKLSFAERMQMLYAKGSRYYEDEPTPDATITDIDMDSVAEHIKRIGYTKSPEDYIRNNNNFILTKYGREDISNAAILLFGKKPQNFFPRARVRFIRYQGIEPKVGSEMNVIKDIQFNGSILNMLQDSIDFVQTQIKEHTYLGEQGLFKTEQEYPEFCWKEIIVNAITHRDYSMKGTDIQIKMFDDHLSVESPGSLPGMVRIDNIREKHFSRNPKIAQFLHECEYVREFGEGIDRIYQEMSAVHLPDPEFKADRFTVFATLKNNLPAVTPANTYRNGEISGEINGEINRNLELENLSANEIKIYNALKIFPRSSRTKLIGITEIAPRTFDRTIKKMIEKKDCGPGRIKQDRILGNNPLTKNTKRLS